VHRLRDLSRPEWVSQCHPDLADEFPPLPSLDAHATPAAQRTTFIGHTAEVAELTELVGTERLVTFTGSGRASHTPLIPDRVVATVSALILL